MTGASGNYVIPSLYSLNYKSNVFAANFYDLADNAVLLPPALQSPPGAPFLDDPGLHTGHFAGAAADGAA